MQIFNSKGSLITNMESWEHAFKEVDSAKHWKPGYSAHALAKHFTAPSVDDSHGLDTILKGLWAFGVNEVSLDNGIVEFESRFDGFGKGRVHDLAIWGEADDKPLVVCVEAKVNEGFGTTVKRTIEERLKNSQDSKIKNRVQGIAGDLAMDYDDILDLPYQLLTFLAGGIHEAAKLENGVLYLPVIVYNTTVHDPENGFASLRNYVETMEALGFSHCDNDDIIMYKGTLGNIQVLSSCIVAKVDSEEEKSLSYDHRLDKILYDFLSLDPYSMSPVEIYERVREIKNEYKQTILGIIE